MAQVKYWQHQDLCYVKHAIRCTHSGYCVVNLVFLYSMWQSAVNTAGIFVHDAPEFPKWIQVTGHRLSRLFCNRNRRRVLEGASISLHSKIMVSQRVTICTLVDSDC